MRNNGRRSIADVSDVENGENSPQFCEKEPKETLLASLRSNSFVTVLVLFWYSAAVISITTSKELLISEPYPYFLCTIQFSIAFFVSRVVASSTNSYRSLERPSAGLIVAIAICYSLGFVFTNIAFNIVPTSFAETVKSSEPVTSVIFGYFFYSEYLNMKAYATLVPICIGVAMSCFSNDDFNVLGFVLAAGSNVFFSARAVLAKVLAKTHPDAVNEISLFAHISLIGIFISLPFSILIDLFPALSSSLELHDSMHMLKLFILYSMNGLAYSTYNFMSFMVLMRTTIATHAVLNVFRRVVIIVFTSFYFGSSLRYLNIFGIALSVCGVLLFNFIKQSE